MREGVRIDISGESAHEKALLSMHKDLLFRECEDFTEEPLRVSNISALESAINALGLKDVVRDKDRSKETVNFNVLKGKVLRKINDELRKASEKRYDIAKSSFDLGLGVDDDDQAA